MLLNNFKPLITFNDNDVFVNVLGTTVNKIDMLYNDNSTGYSRLNNSRNLGTLSFNHNVTNGSNNYKNEQTLYSWTGIVANNTANTHCLNGLTIFVGSGNTDVNIDDYKLESPLDLDVTSLECNCSNNKLTVIRTFKNNTEEPITINEIGLYLYRTGSSNHSVKNTQIVMIARKILPAPLILGSGESNPITYSIDMSQITFEEADE